ncbi:BRCA1-associated RING domain protein 1 [Aulostomus maculatus]
MDKDVLAQTNEWKKTKEAVANFRRLLICSKCSDLLKEPVCLGTCEHMLCRPCAGPRAGDGCVVCHSPAWVKDIQINRQLSSIIQLFCGLESLLKPEEEPVGTQSEGSVLKHKTNFKIWFSPRSRKVRCIVEKPPPTNQTTRRSPGESAPPHPDTTTAQHKDLAVFNFTSSSQDSGSSGSQRCPTNKNRKKKSDEKKPTQRKEAVKRATRRTCKQRKQMMKRKKLEAINQQWGITEERDALTEEEQVSEEAARRSSKRVSFLSPDVSSVEPQGAVKENQTQLCQNTPATANQRDTLSADDRSPEEGVSTSSLKHASKPSRLEEKAMTLETTPKRPRASPGPRRKSLCHMSPTLLNPPSLTSPRHERSTRSPRESPSFSSNAGRKSPSTRSSAGRLGSGSPAVMRKNHKGETPLHLAAIKGDVEAVRELLDQGADPNLKDNAGWTPLHEACNLGHLAVMEVLVSRGALLNTPGYKNDSPLHDAVRNGHTAIVKVLLQLGASQNTLNLYGKRPADYAVSVEMLEIFQEASEGTQNANASPNPSASLSVVSDCVMTEENIVFLPCQLSHTEQQQLTKLGQLLEGRRADTFTGSVSHVVVPEGAMPTSSSTLLGLLAGCWVVRYSWVEACLQAGKRMPENEHEAGEGPQRSRINRCSLLPPLFDGCFFFLLGTFKAPTKDELTRLLREGGGQLLSRQPKPDSDVTQTLSAAAYHALPGSDQALCTQYIIFDPRGPHKPAVVRRGKVWSAPSSWIIDCIAAFRLLPVPAPQPV